MNGISPTEDCGKVGLRMKEKGGKGKGVRLLPPDADRAECRLCAGVGVVVCVGGAVASLDGEANLILPLLLLSLLLLLLFLLLFFLQLIPLL